MARTHPGTNLSGQAHTDSPAQEQPVIDTSDEALASVLARLKDAVDPEEIRGLTRQLERIVFHKQFMNA